MKRILRRALPVLLLAALLCLLTLPALAADTQDCGAKLIAFTFDDGPGAYTRDLLDGLAARGAKATFFIAGYRVSSYPGVLDAIVEGGHQLANHTYNHADLNTLTYDGVRQEVEATRRLLAEVGGELTYYVRPPYGNANSTVRSAVDVPLINWSVDSLDWQSLNAQAVCSSILKQAYDGAIVLVHDIYRTSVQGALAAIDALSEQGYEFVTVEELLLRRGVTPEAGIIYYDAKNKGVNLPADAVVTSGYDESNISSHWGYDAMLFCLEHGYLEYGKNGLLLPDHAISRGDFAMALARFCGVDASYTMQTGGLFTDVSADDARRPYIDWVFDAGLMAGYEMRFRPDDSITREEIATVLSRYLTLRGKAQPIADPDGVLAIYSDSAKISDWAREGAALCTRLAIFLGSGDAFLPQRNLTRAQAAMLLQRLLAY